MQFKYIPKRWNGQPVVSFVTIDPKPGEVPYAGIALLQSNPATFTVIRLNADSMDPDARWEGVNGEYSLDWTKARLAFVRRVTEAFRTTD